MDTKPLKISSDAKKSQTTKASSSSFSAQDKTKWKVSLKERQEKKYPFSSMLDELLKSKLLQLPELKRPEEANQVNDPNYCKYHRLISHPMEKCFVLKDKIMELYNEGKVEFDDEAASSNLASITIASPQSNAVAKTIKFGFFEPVILVPTVEEVKDLQGSGGNACSQEDTNDDDEGWTLVTRRKRWKEDSYQTCKSIKKI